MFSELAAISYFVPAGAAICTLLLPSPAGGFSFSSFLSVDALARYQHLGFEEVYRSLTIPRTHLSLHRNIIITISAHQSTEDLRSTDTLDHQSSFKMLTSFITLALATAAAALPASGATVVSPDPTQVSIAGIVYGGTGCPQGTVGSFISDDRQTCVTPLDK